MANAKNQRGPLWRSNVTIVILALGLLVGMTGTAAADHSAGEGVGTGTESLTHDPRGPEVPLCLPVTASQYVVGGDGTGIVGVAGEFMVHNGTTTAAVAGTDVATITMTTNETYYISPTGTYTTSDCSGAPDFVDITVEVTGDISCAKDTTGQYRRTTDVFEVYWSAKCTILSVTSANVLDHVFIGELTPCVECAEGDPLLEGSWTYPRAVGPTP